MLRSAYPNGLARSDVDYPAVLAVLYSRLSQKNAAHVLEITFGIIRGIAHNDVLGVETAATPSTEVARVVEKLEPHGYRAWLEEPD